MDRVTYWKKEVETLPREQLEELQLHRFSSQVDLSHSSLKGELEPHELL